MKLSALALFGLMLLASPVFATIYTVNPSGSGDFPSISSALLFMVAGDELLLEDGVYSGAFNRNNQLTGQDVRIASINGPDNCRIDCSGLGVGFAIFSGETPATVIEGITITYGSIATNGGGMVIANASPTIRNCVFRFNYGTIGGGLSVINGTPVIEDCVFDRNTAESGAGVFASGPDLVFLRCSFTGNVASSRGGGFLAGGGGKAVTFQDCVFDDNEALNGGAGYSGYSRATIAGSVVCNNTASSTGGAFHFQGETQTIAGSTLFGNSAASSGACVQVRDGASLSVTHSILSFGLLSGAAKCANGGSIVLSCSDVYGNAGGDYVDCIAGQQLVNGNLSTDPAFCDAGAKDFTLASSSPCAPAQSPVCGLIGARDTGCGGSTATEETSWGDFKQLFR